jgi:hypothetical protein
MENECAMLCPFLTLFSQQLSAASLESPLSDHGDSSSSGSLASMAADDGSSGKVKSFWAQFDKSYMQPLFGGKDANNVRLSHWLHRLISLACFVEYLFLAISEFAICFADSFM